MMTCWGITDGSAGMVAQVRSLALAMGLQPEMKVIALKKPWMWLPNIFYDGFFLKLILPCALRTPENIEQPYPEIIISCGRKAALVAAAIKKSVPGVKVIYIQDPQMSSKHFDVVVAMEHDKISGENVIKTRFALHRINKEILEKAREQFAPKFAAYAHPHISVLIGGSTNKYSLTKERMETLIAGLQAKFAGTKGSLLITTSRRTGAENIAALKSELAGSKNIYIYDGEGENPYIGLLACADEIMVTNDSVNMMSEAFATGKKVSIINLEGHENTKPALFAEILKNSQSMVGDEMEKLAEQIWTILQARKA